MLAEKEEPSRSTAGYLVNHTARLYLLSPQQELQLNYAFDFDPSGLRRDLKHLSNQ